MSYNPGQSFYAPLAGPGREWKSPLSLLTSVKHLILLNPVENEYSRSEDITEKSTHPEIFR